MPNSANAQNAQFAMTPIPYHTHNGKDSPSVDVSNIANLPAYGNMETSVYDQSGIDQQLLGVSATQTVTNKRLTRRLVTVTQSATPAIDTDSMDIASITGLAQGITSMTTSLSGTPVDGDLLEIRITDNGSAQTITWGASFESTTITLPSTTVISTMLRIGLEWNATASKWDCIAVA